MVITGCGQAGIVNIVTFAEKHFADRPIYSIVGICICSQLPMKLLTGPRPNCWSFT